MTPTTAPTDRRPESRRAEELFRDHLASIHRRTDRLFAGLLACEWGAAIVAALWLSPVAWAGLDSRTHPHVWAAVFLGLAVTSLPVALALLRPGRASTRHAVAVGQMLMSALLIHLTGGRIETHFHVFGSLAFLAFYRDWRVLVTASAVVAADHCLRGLFWPESVFGTLADGGWRWVEHAGWVAFEDLFLVNACLQGIREMRGIAERQACLESVNATVEAAVRERTAELAASEAESARLAAIVAGSDDAILSTDLDGVISTWNVGAERLFGYPAGEVVGRCVSFLIPPDQADQSEDALRRARRGEAVQAFRTARLHKTGRRIDVAVSVSPIRDSDGRVVGAAKIVQDVTHMRRLEDQFRQAQKMEAVGHLAGGVAHDFNNLLTVINGYSEMLIAETPAGDGMAATLAEIHGAGVRAADLTRQLLAFSRQSLLQPKVIDLNDLLANLQRMLARLIGEDVRLSTSFRPSLGRVRVDPGQVEQVVVNLCVNARDAMPQGGRLTVETDEVELDEAYARNHPEVRQGRYVLLSVSDTGCGMTEEVKARLFEPFFTTKGVGKGTGLGLATVYGIVKQSGGHLSVYSEVGRGTAFKVFLPRVEGAAAASGVVRREPAPGGRETVLLVEDDPRVRKLALSALQRGGYMVVEAGCAEEAVRARDRHRGPIDLLLTDVVMPGASGRALAEQLAASDPDLRVLYMSGYTDDAVVRHGILSAEVAFIQKPFAVDALLRAVRKVLDGRPAPELRPQAACGVG